MLDKQKNAGELKPYLRNANVQWGYFDLNEVHSMALSKDEQARFLLQQGDLMVCEGGEPGRCAIWGSRSCEMYYQKALHRVRCASDSLEVEYCAIVVEYYVRARLLESKMTGTTIKHLPARNLERMLVPLPSLVEQRRIAARVAELMPLVEQYGALEDEREALDAGLADRLRKSVLQEAVQGRLAAQDASDEPASALLERIRAERAAKVAAGELKAPKGGESVIYRDPSDGAHYEKRGKGEPVCIEDEIPFDVPRGWEWARLGSFINLLSGVDLQPACYNDAHRGIPYLTGASNFDNGDLIENRWTEAPTRISLEGELLFTCKGTVGQMAINRFEKAHIARQIMSIAPLDASTLAYIEVFLKSIVMNIRKDSKGVIPGIERATLLNALIPVPPLAEQHRIVARVEELTTLTSQLPR